MRGRCASGPPPRPRPAARAPAAMSSSGPAFTKAPAARSSTTARPFWVTLGGGGGAGGRGVGGEAVLLRAGAPMAGGGRGCRQQGASASCRARCEDEWDQRARHVGQRLQTF